MIKYFKKVIREWFMADKVEELELIYQAKIDALNINDLIKEKLKGFNPRNLLNTEDFLTWKLGKNYTLDDKMAYLSKFKDLADNQELRDLHEWLVRNQILFSVKEAENIIQVNFGRASVNGMDLLVEEIDGYSQEYEALKEDKTDTDYDIHELT